MSEWLDLIDVNDRFITMHAIGSFVAQRRTLSTSAKKSSPTSS
jgi:hypothetical protein